MISKIMREMIFYFDNDVKRINHALKVHSFAKTICQLENLSTEEKIIIELTAILHDIGIKESERKYNSSSGKYQELEGPPIARNILNNYDIDTEMIERVCYIIGNHHTYNNIKGIDYQIIIESDFIVNIYEDSINKDTIKNIKSNYFKTKSGIELFSSLYL
ncbi:MAG: HD domain-containing protein [Eubacteriaceae bacterium]